VVDLLDPRDADGGLGVKATVAAALFGTDTPQRFPRIGRFRVTGELGRGGMGEVLAGFDDELERKVAIKLLHPSIGDEHRTRLKREAKALAKLSHPNVVHVYEVGTHESRLFIAMEYVVGRTLRRWLAEQEPSLDEVLAVFIAAGRGLVAAHAAGLVHRDFKPDNVLVGEDRRPRVLDFGLARADGSGPGSAAGIPLETHQDVGEDVPSFESRLDETLTSAGAILGTPAYMPPEQLTGMGTSPASDQFSFCAALFEALYGGRPFRGDSLQLLTLAVVGGELSAPPHPRGPSALRKIVEHGLAREPGDRWPDMESLLAALERVRGGPQRLRRRVFMVGAVAVTLSTTAWAIFAPPSASSPGRVAAVSASPCRPASTWFEGVWDRNTKTELAAKYRAAPRRAQDWWRSEERLLDDWTRTWSEIYETSCSTEADVDRPRFERRKTCLEQRMIEIRTRVRLLEELRPEARADAALIDYYPFYLPAECEDERTLLGLNLFPAQASERARLVDALVDMRVVEARGQAASVGAMPGAHAEVMKATPEVIANVEATGFKAAIAELRLRWGNGLLVAGLDAEQGFAALDEAILLARQTRSERLRVFAELSRLRQAAVRGLRAYADPDVATDLEEWESALDSVGAPAGPMIPLLTMRARHLAAAGERDRIGPVLDRTVAVAVSAYGEDSVFTIQTLDKAANIYSEAGLDAQSERARARAIDLVERVFGPDAAQLYFPLRHAVEHALRGGRLDEAETTARRLARVMRLHHEVGSIADVEAQVVLVRVLMAQRRNDEVEAILHDIDPYAADLHGGAADRWALARLVYLALAGKPDDAARVAANHPARFLAATELAATLAPLFDDELDPEARARDIAAGLESMQFPISTAAAWIQVGRLREQLGRPHEAAEAYRAAAQLDSTEADLDSADFQQLLSVAAAAGVERTNAASR
jgi:tRNA A-37 threonylcarbamoyl transferase component Bud32